MTHELIEGKVTSKPRILVSTYDGDRLEAQKHIVWNNADKQWLESHLHWAFHNNRRITLERVDTKRVTAYRENHLRTLYILKNEKGREVDWNLTWEEAKELTEKHPRFTMHEQR